MLISLVLIAGLAQHKLALRGEPTAFVCDRGACQMPTGDPAVLATQLAHAMLRE